MKLLRKFAIGLGILLTDILLLCCCLFFTVIADKMEAITPNYLLWIGLVVICFLVNLFIVKKGKGLTLLLTWNMIWMALTAVITVLTFQCEPASVFFKVFVCGVLIVIEGHSIAQAILPQKASTQMTFLDILVVAFAIFLAGCHIKNLDNVIGLQIFGFICVGYTLVALIFLRTYEEQVNIARGESVASRVKVFGLLGVIVAVSCLACCFLTVMAKNVGSSLLDIIGYMAGGFKNGLLKLGNIFTDLFSKIPGVNTEGALPAANTGETLAEETGADAVGRLPDWIFPLVGILVLALVVFLVIRLVIKLRKEKIPVFDRVYKPVEITVEQTKEKRPSLFKRIFDKWKLHIKMYQERKTPEGLALSIRKAGKSIGIEMNPDDSWHGYVMKLTPYGDSCQLEELSNYMKEYFYSGKSTPLSRDQYQRFSNSLKHLKKPESATE